MKKRLHVCSILLMAGLLTGCGFKIFEDIGSDPHPPTLQIVSLSIYVEPPTTTSDRGAASPAAKIITYDSGGFSVAPGQTFQIEFSYFDAGGDISVVKFRDLDGKASVDLSPAEGTYFPGTTGTFIGPDKGAEVTGLLGPHRFNLWAEDSHGSRSEKIEFLVTIPP